MKLIVGLGNPGPGYARSRHNIGFQYLKYLSEIYHIPVDKRHCLSRVGEGRIEGVDVVLARPHTYMNLSGKAVACLARRHRVSPAEVLVIHDDLDLPVGKVRLKANGGSGGHKGVESIVESLGTKDFSRIRIGIGRPGDKTAEAGAEVVIDYVLSDFTPEEERLLKQKAGKVGDAVCCILNEGIQSAMNKFN